LKLISIIFPLPQVHSAAMTKDFFAESILVTSPELWSCARTGVLKKMHRNSAKMSFRTKGLPNRGILAAPPEIRQSAAINRAKLLPLDGV
jgi:hypothetical protein